MSVARQVVEVEQGRANWLAIEDDNGRVHYYAKRGLADAKLPAHVECLCVPGKQAQAVLAERDGQATLRHDGPGFPDKIRVRYAELQTIPVAPMPVSWSNTLEYELIAKDG